MLTSFYRRHSPAIVWMLVLSFPFLFVVAQSIRANNDVETWLPRASPVRAAYEQFKRDFGVEETILIGLDRTLVSDEVVNSVAIRLERLPGIRKCWSPDRLVGIMRDMGCTEVEARKRLENLALSSDGKFLGLIAILSKEGIAKRAEAVADVRRELDYCQLQSPQSFMTGAPVIVTELDRLGGQESGQKFFLITLCLCMGLLCYLTRDWKLSLSLLGLTLWAIQCTQAIFATAGGEMNFILGALPILVMVFTLEASLHVLHYHTISINARDPLAEALRLCWKPCLVSMVTTAIGLFSVSVTDILPVTQFGLGAALGALVAMLTGLLFTPALLIVMPANHAAEDSTPGLTQLGVIGNWCLARHRQVVYASVAIVAVGALGIAWMKTRINALDFLPANSQALVDLHKVQQDLTNVDSIEGVVDFGPKPPAFMEQLTKVREIETQIAAHKSVRHVMSASMFLPGEMPENPFALAALLKKAESQRGESDYVTRNGRLWRISARVSPTDELSCAAIHKELQTQLASQPIQFTGIAPLIEQAQCEIFNGFWQSFTCSFVVIGVVMAIALRSPKIAFLAMIPNVAPLAVVFGTLGWLNIPVDIGMMMTGSIALGISVDGTFHFLVRYQEQLAEGKCRMHASRIALLTTGGPIFESIIVSSIGMLALTLSSFSPTSRFGALMAISLMATLIGDLILLPALLCVGRGATAARKPRMRETIRRLHHRATRRREEIVA